MSSFAYYVGLRAMVERHALLPEPDLALPREIQNLSMFLQILNLPGIGRGLVLKLSDKVTTTTTFRARKLVSVTPYEKTL